MAKQEAFPVLRRSFRLLEVMGQRQSGITFNEVSSLFPDAPASSVSRLLKALQEEKMITKGLESRLYLLGERAEDLGKKLRGQISFSQLLRPVVDALADELGSSAVFFKMNSESFELVVKHEVPDGFHYMAEGQSNINFASHGAGLVMMAYLSPENFERLWKSNVQIHPSKPIKTEFMDKIRKVQENACCYTPIDERSYMSRVMVPVFRGEQFVGALGVSMLGKLDVDKAGIQNMISTVKEKAAQATQILSRF